MTLKGLVPLAKKVLRLRGSDTLPFLQGVLTNDVYSEAKVVYSYLLNSQGRVLFDLFLYKLGESDVLLETDATLESSLLKVLNLYKMRRSVSIETAPYTACASFGPLDSGIIDGPDPRLPQLGVKSIRGTGEPDSRMDLYRELRYRLGVPEGPSELGTGKAIPLESNGDYLNAISFDKGCYIGQELTARAHHTGVIRKRYMPISFPKPQKISCDAEELSVLSQNGAKVGVLKAVMGTRGLGLMRIRESLEAGDLSIEVNGENVEVEVSCPEWWPKLSMP
ncbi:putative transferase CAF17 homolog, mitochondrial [Galendromus occidentalis]|uniref:Transferase CAF17 homolog, mitochondrial n=1 Tax=Galendromus occidentalis TaxID=34638 RepID=A0AAJ7SGM5_9ACAR|nr:putative transferase CAF17 homolog, mitochondrial [Galendromus occidentalis]